MYLYRHPRETKENKLTAGHIIHNWARPIFHKEDNLANMTKEEKDAENKKKREATAKAQRQGKRSQLAIDKRMDTVVRSQRDAREKARLERARQEIQKFIKEDLIEGLIERAYCYGESLEVCKDIQRKYEMRPVTKYIYPLLQQFQFSCAGVQPKSL